MLLISQENHHQKNFVSRENAKLNSMRQQIGSGQGPMPLAWNAGYFSLTEEELYDLEKEQTSSVVQQQQLASHRASQLIKEEDTLLHMVSKQIIFFNFLCLEKQ